MDTFKKCISTKNKIVDIDEFILLVDIVDYIYILTLIVKIE
jgi:hypothetical protein